MNDKTRFAVETWRSINPKKIHIGCAMAIELFDENAQLKAVNEKLVEALSKIASYTAGGSLTFRESADRHSMIMVAREALAEAAKVKGDL